MSIRIKPLAKALNIPIEMSEEDLKEASKIFEENNFLSNIDDACNVVLAGKVLQRIKELTEKVDKL